MQRHVQNLYPRGLQTRVGRNLKALSGCNFRRWSIRQVHSFSSSPAKPPIYQWGIFATLGTTCLWGAYMYGQHSASSKQVGKSQSTLMIAESSISQLKDQQHPSWNMSQENIDGASQELIQILGADGVSDNLADRINHSSTAWSEAPRGDDDKGSLIVYPKSTADVSEIAKICHRRRIPMIPFSGGTSLESTLAAVHQEIYVDFSKMNKIFELHEQDMDIIVQPGVGFMDLNEYLSPKKLFFPPDPGPGAQIGGMIAQGCSGTNAYRYGTMKDWVLGLTVVLADGTIIKTRHRPRKSSAGYDLTRLFVGSEGTLGFVTEASLRLAPKPENVHVAVAVFPSVQSAIQTSVNIVKSELMLGAMELLDDLTMRALNASGHLDKEWPELTTLFFKLSGSEDQVNQQAREVERLAKEQNCTLFNVSKNQKEADSLWQARKTALWSLSTLKKDPDDKFQSADICVPISRLGDMIDATNASFENSGFVGSCLGHVGDGNFHASLFFPEKDKAKARFLLQHAQRLGVEMGGTVTGEHGIGLVNRDALVWELGEDSVAAMRRIKLALDPLCLMNPGKMFKLWEDEQ